MYEVLAVVGIAFCIGFGGWGFYVAFKDAFHDRSEHDE